MKRTRAVLHLLATLFLLENSFTLRFNDNTFQMIEEEYEKGDRKKTNEEYLNKLNDEGFANGQDVINDMIETMKEDDKQEQEKRSFSKQCNKDYTGYWMHHCAAPYRWKHKGSGFRCTAPAAYKGYSFKVEVVATHEENIIVDLSGPCATVMNFNMDREAKAEIERSCQISWPCLGACDRDFDALCPLGWISSSGLVCQAPWFYSDRCERRKDFTHFTSIMKETWTKNCNVLWPCRNACEKDYTSQCPDGWQYNSIGNVCTAPNEYQGPCGPEESIAPLDHSLRVLFESRCEVSFPCAKERCQIDFSQLCPSDWTAVVDDDTCIAPGTYGGNCDHKLNLVGKTINEKKDIQTRCGLSWACKQTCVKTYLEPCPLNWVFKPAGGGQVKSGEGTCVPLPSYQGPCARSKKLYDKTKEMRQVFEEHCQAPWPCSTEVPGMIPRRLSPPPPPLGSPSAENGPIDSITGATISQKGRTHTKQK